MADDETGESIFKTLFNREPPTPEEIAELEERDRHESNERQRIAFETARDKRAERIELDNRIRRIAAEEASKGMLVIAVIAASVYATNTYGGFWGIAVFIAAGFWLLWVERDKRKSSHYRQGDVDEIAEDTVRHERVIALETANQPWLEFTRYGVEVVGIYEEPYWREVNTKVGSMLRMNHKDRVAAYKAAAAASLPFRQAMLAKIKANNAEEDLPYWAQVRNDTRHD